MEEKKKKSFWKGRLGIGIIAVVAFVMLTTGSVYAFNFFTATTTVTVAECMTVANAGNDGGEQMDLVAFTWNPSIDPGSSKILNLLITNKGTGTLIGVAASDDCAYANVTAAWSTNGNNDFGPGESETYTLTVTVSQGAPDQSYPFNITIAR